MVVGSRDAKRRLQSHENRIQAERELPTLARLALASPISTHSPSSPSIASPSLLRTRDDLYTISLIASTATAYYRLVLVEIATRRRSQALILSVVQLVTVG